MYNSEGKCSYSSKYVCPNMKEKVPDLSLNYDYYECKVCGQAYKLDYDEMR